jgi:cytochrome c
MTPLFELCAEACLPSTWGSATVRVYRRNKMPRWVVGVVGRKAGTTKSLLGPTENLTKYGVIWSAETLNEFLANPDAKAPGTPMAGMIVDAQQRADVIAYLSTLK